MSSLWASDLTERMVDSARFRLAKFAGTYQLDKEIVIDIENLTEIERNDPIKPELTIKTNGFVYWGAGKTHELELEEDFEGSVITLVEDYTIGRERYVNEYTLEITEKHFILYSKPLNKKLTKYYFNRL